MTKGRALVLAANFYPALTRDLESDARAFLEARGLEIETRTVPGVFELPTALSLSLGEGHALHVALGVVVRGETDHYDLICRSVTGALQEIAWRNALAFGFGVIAAGSKAQAAARADPGGRHRVGRRAAEAAWALHRLGGGAAS